MVGSKHKNGIICTFPDCNKPMRTQKFKMHFTRAHLKDGEVYSVEHRRQYEVAREENLRCEVKHELAPATSSMTMGEISRVETMISNSANAAHEGIQVVDGAVNASGTIPIAAIAPTSAQEQSIGNKRPAAAMEASAEAVDPTSALLMQFIALMDQRFQELVSKMGEMIDVQKDLIDTLQATNPNGQAPASAFSHAVDAVMKRRKRDTSPRARDDTNGHENSDGGSNDNGGFAL